MPRHVILGAGGGISAYKACELLRRLTESGYEVRVIPTRDALRFVGEATWAALSGRPAIADAWHDVHEVPHVGLGRWADLVFIAPATADLLARAAAGRAVVISAGGTREELDPVRFLGNWSSGKQGYALARTATARGADVTLVSANVALDDPAGAKVIRVTSALQLRDAMAAAAAGADAVVMAAAVADYRPAVRHQSKIKKTAAGPEPIRLTENPDVPR